jgi:hypothetical protein
VFVRAGGGTDDFSPHQPQQAAAKGGAQPLVRPVPQEQRPFDGLEKLRDFGGGNGIAVSI